jgi:hypothetical protein
MKTIDWFGPLAVSVTALFPPETQGNDVYVDGSWGGAQTGTQVQPYRSIAAAFGVLPKGAASTVFIKGGEYHEQNLSLAASGSGAANPIVVRPIDGGGDVVIDGAFSGALPKARCLNITGSFVTVQSSDTARLVVRNFDMGGIRSSGVSTRLSGIVLENIANSTNGSSAISFYQAKGGTIESCIISNVGVRAINLTQCNGTEAADFIVAKNQIHGVNILPGGGWIYGIALNSCQYVAVSSNVITMTDPGGWGAYGIVMADGDLKGTNGFFTITHNVLEGNPDPYARRNCSGIVTSASYWKTLISNNTVYHWGNYGIDIGGTGRFQSQDVMVSGNRCYNNGRGNYAVDGECTGADRPITLRNNISYLNVPPPAGNDYNGGFDFHGDVDYCTARVNWFNNIHWTDQSSVYACGLWTDTHTGTGTYRIQNNIFVTAGGHALKWQDGFTNSHVQIDDNAFFSSNGQPIRFQFGTAARVYDSAHVVGDQAGYFSYDTGKGRSTIVASPKLAAPPNNVGFSFDSPCWRAGFSIDFSTAPMLTTEIPCNLGPLVPAPQNLRRGNL